MIRQLCRAASRRILKNNANNLIFINNNVSILPTSLKTPKKASSNFLRIFCTVRDLDFVGKVAIDPESFSYEDKDTPIEYFVYGRRYVGIIQRPMGRRHWAIVNQQGKEEKINKYQLSFQWPKAPVPLSHEQVRSMEGVIAQARVTGTKVLPPLLLDESEFPGVHQLTPETTVRAYFVGWADGKGFVDGGVIVTSDTGSCAISFSSKPQGRVIAIQSSRSISLGHPAAAYAISLLCLRFPIDDVVKTAERITSQALVILARNAQFYHAQYLRLSEYSKLSVYGHYFNTISEAWGLPARFEKTIIYRDYLLTSGLLAAEVSDQHLTEAVSEWTRLAQDIDTPAQLAEECFTRDGWRECLGFWEAEKGSPHELHKVAMIMISGRWVSGVADGAVNVEIPFEKLVQTVAQKMRSYVPSATLVDGDVFIQALSGSVAIEQNEHESDAIIPLEPSMQRVSSGSPDASDDDTERIDAQPFPEPSGITAQINASETHSGRGTDEFAQGDQSQHSRPQSSPASKSSQRKQAAQQNPQPHELSPASTSAQKSQQHSASPPIIESAQQVPLSDNVVPQQGGQKFVSPSSSVSEDTPFHPVQPSLSEGKDEQEVHEPQSTMGSPKTDPDVYAKAIAILTSLADYGVVSMLGS